MATRIQLRRDTTANWTSENPTLAQGELGYETDTGKLKLGDGVTAWNSLAYYYTTANLNDISDVTITDAADGDFLRWNGEAWINDAVNLGTDSVGDYIESITGGTGVTVFEGTGESAAASIAIGQDVSTNADVTFNSVSAELSGNASTASALETPRIIFISGGASGSASFDGTENIDISVTIENDSVELGTDTTGNYVQSITAGTGVIVYEGEGESAAASVSIGQDVSTSADVTFNSVNADVTGNLTGNADTASALETPRTIFVSGGASGSAAFDGSDDIDISVTIQPDSVELGADTTGDFVAGITAGTGVGVTDGTGENTTATIYIGQDVGTAASVQFGAVTTTGDIVVGGNLTVNGDTTTLNVSELYVEDNIILLNYGQSGPPTLNAGIEVRRGEENDVTIRWEETENVWEFTNDGLIYHPLPTELNDIPDVNITDPQQADVLSYDSITSTWQNAAPTFNGLTDVVITDVATGDFVKYDGSGNWVNEPINLGADTVGDFVESLVAGTGISLADNSGENATPTISIGQDVATDADVTFNSVSASLTGNASTASALETARTIFVSGAVSGSASFDGTENIDISVAVQPDGVELGAETTGDYIESVTGGVGVTVYNGTGEGASTGIAIGQDVSTNANVTFNTVTADLVGNADTASALAIPRTISLGGDLAGSAEFDGSGNITINAEVQANFDSIDSLSDVVITSAVDGQILQFNGSTWVNTTQPNSEPMGFENRTDSVISFTDASRQFSIAPASSTFTVWAKGKRFVKDSTETLTIGTTTGLYYIFYNSSGSLGYSTTYFDWENAAPVAYVYWNATTAKAEFFADERHGVTLDWQTHEYLHRTRGAALASGFGISGYTTTGDGSSDADTQIALAGGTFFDEDLQVDITHSATPTANTWEQVLEGTAEIPVFYLSGTSWVKDAATTSPFKAGTSRPAYNLNTGGTWSTPDIANNKYGTMWIVATNNLNEPIIAILGQVQGDNQSQVEERNWSDVSLPDFPIFELRPLYRIIYYASDTFSNTLSAAIRGVLDIRRATSGGEGSAAEAVSDHGSLTGLGDDDHTQYLTTGRHDLHDHSTAMSSVVLDDISNVSASSPSDGNYLVWDNSGGNWVPGTVTLGTDTIGSYVESLVAGTGVTLADNSGEGATPSIAIGQDVATNADVEFNSVTSTFSGNLTGNVTGNADTATALATSRTIEISGGVAGSALFDGSGDINISTTVQNDSVTLGTSTVGDYVESLVAGTGVYLSNNSGEGATPTVFIGQDVSASADVTFNTVSVTSSPSQANHAATKAYVDNVAAGIDWHEAARLATAAALPNSPDYDNGTSGLGATLTSTVQARLVVDGANANTGDRILVKNESTEANNGIYEVTAQGASGTEYWVLTRTTDFDGTGEDVNPGEAVFVLAGSTNVRQGFVVTSTSSPHSIGSDAITFTQFTGTQAFTAGTGLAQSGNTINVGTASTDRIVVNADDIDLATVTVGSTTGSDTSDFVSSITVDSYGRVTSVETSNVGQDLLTTSDVEFNSVTSNLTGNADTATALETERTIYLSGAASGSATFDGTSDANIVTSISVSDLDDTNTDASYENGVLLYDLGTSTWVSREFWTGYLTGSFLQSLTAGTGVTVFGGVGTNTAASVAIGQDVAVDADVVFGSVTAPIIGDIYASDGISKILENGTDGSDATFTGAVTGTVSDISNHDLGDLGDVNFTVVAAAEGDILYYDGAEWVAQPFTLANMGTVSISSPTTGEFLKYDGVGWVNAVIPEINSIGDISDVVITDLTSSEVLQYNGAEWVNSDILASPALTGTPTAPTAASGTNTTQIATTEFVTGAIDDLVGAAPGALDTLAELALALGEDASFSTTVTNSLALKAPLASPTFTGTVTLPAGTSILHDYDLYGANHTLVAGNEGHTLEFSTTATLTVPPNSSVAFPIGTQIMVIQTGTGNVTVAAGSGVTINYSVGLKTRQQWSAIVLHKRGTDTWLLTGDAKA